MGELWVLIMRLGLLIIPRVFKNRDEQEAARASLQDAIARYERSTLDPASVRRQSQGVDAELKRAWEAKWGPGSKPPSA